MNPSVSLDLETMGINPRAPVLAIGATALCFETFRVGPTFYETVDFEDAFKHGEVDANTVKWWLTQSDAARSALVKGTQSLEDALRKFAIWYGMFDPAKGAPLLWCNGPSFDAVILENAYKACGIKTPWPYNAPRDFRTMRSICIHMLGRDMPNTSDVASHRADEDAIWQGERILEVAKELRSRIQPVLL